MTKFLQLSMYHNGQPILISSDWIISVNPAEVRPGQHPVRTFIATTDGRWHEVRETVDDILKILPADAS